MWGHTNGLEKVVRQIGHLARTAADGMESSGNEAGGELQETLRQTREQLDQVKRDLQRAVKRSARTAEPYIQAHPFSTIAIASTAALALGAVLASRRR